MHRATDRHGVVLAATVTGANANDGVRTKDVLDARVIHPPPPDRPNPAPDPRDRPRVRGDGGYGNGPSRDRARQAGFRRLAPSRGEARRPGVGRVRCAVERGHAFLAQFGRIARRLDRNSERYLGWVQLAASIVMIRTGFVR